MSSNLAVSVCNDNALHIPELESCDECDRLAQEFEQALEDAQAAAADAQASEESVQEMMETVETQTALAETYASNAQASAESAENALSTVESLLIRRFVQDFTTTGYTESVTFAPWGYVYDDADTYSVYVNGLRLNESEYERSGNIITFTTPISESGQVIEVVVERFMDADAVSDDRIYAAKWDKTSNLYARLLGAADITTDTTNFCHHGSINANYDNPFDSIYPWSDVVTCNVNLTKYRALSAGADIRTCIDAVYGDPDFTYFGDDKTFVGVYVPEFWHKREIGNNGSWTSFISVRERIGYKHHIPEFRPISWGVDDGSGNNTITSGAGIPLTNVAMSTIHTRAKNSGFTLTNIDSDDAIIALFLVEYANWNGQAAIGNGCSSCYRQSETDVIANVDNTGTYTTFEVTDSALSSYIYVGMQVDFGASVGGTTYKGIVTEFSESDGTYAITLDRLLTSLTDGMYMSVHGFASCEFPYIGQSLGNQSGYLGVDGKANAYYRGMVLWGNRYRYTLGIYRQTNTNHIWLCPDGVDPDDYDALNTSVHYDTGVALPELTAGAWLTVGANAQPIPKLYGFVATGTSSGSSVSPIGDQQYVPPISTGNTVLLSGGAADGGWNCGLVCGSWYYAAGNSFWASAASPLLETPQ